MDITLINHIYDFEKLHDCWENTLQDSSANSFFLTHTWLNTWLKNYSRSGQLYVLLASERSKIVGIAPWIVRNREGFRRLATIGQETIDYEHIIWINGVNGYTLTKTFLTYLVAHPNWDLLQFNRIPGDHECLDILRVVLTESGLQWNIQLTETSSHVEIANWDAYWASLAKNFRANIGNRMRRLERDFEDVYFGEVESAQEVEQATHRLMELHRQRREKVDGVDSLFGSRKTRDFYTELAQNLFRHGWLRMPYIRINEELAAVQFNVVYAKTYYKILPTFDERFAKYALGDLLNIHVLKECFMGDCTRLDFLRGDESYKSKYNPRERDLYTVTAFAPTLRGRLAERWFSHLRPFCKENQAVRNLVVKGRALLTSR